MKINEAYECLSDSDRRRIYYEEHAYRESIAEFIGKSSPGLRTLMEVGKSIWSRIPTDERNTFLYELGKYLSNKDDLQRDMTLIFNHKGM